MSQRKANQEHLASCFQHTEFSTHVTRWRSFHIATDFNWQDFSHWIRTKQSWKRFGQDRITYVNVIWHLQRISTTKTQWQCVTCLEYTRIAYRQRPHQRRGKHVYKTAQIRAVLQKGHSEPKTLRWQNEAMNGLSNLSAQYVELSWPPASKIDNYSEFNMRNYAALPFVSENRSWQLISAGFSVCLHDL